ncbi:MAG: hypothetical protein E7478_07385 [Ruminococcaceae bacterium]|nr:hypothetical protein [Oscillospiraceae bacterium]
MKKLLVLFAACAIALTATACGDSSKNDDDDKDKDDKDTSSKTSSVVEEDTSSDDESSTVSIVEDDNTSSATDDFTLLDVTADMIQAGVYAMDENGTELVLTLFTMPNGTPMTSLFYYNPNETCDVICGSYTGSVSTDENNITWTNIELIDEYTGGSFTIGVAESTDGQVLIYDSTAKIYEGKYLTNDETIAYMAAGVALMG